MKTTPWMIAAAISSFLLSSFAPAQAATPAQLGVFRPQTGQWFVDYSGNRAWNRCGPDGCLGQFGAPIDLPISGDWSGNGVPKMGVFRPADGRWYLDLNGNSSWDGCGTDGCFGPFGAPVDRPVIGDWDGTGSLRFGVFRPTTGQWYFDLNGNGKWDGCETDRCQGPFGASEDWPVAGDMDGDTVTEFGVYRPSTGMWYFDFDHNGSWSGCGPDGCLGPFGAPEDRPVLTDIDGNGRLERGVFRPTTGQWYFDLDHNGTWSGCGADGCFGGFGGSGDLPVVGAWDRYAGPGDPLNYFPLTQGSTWIYQGSYSDSDGFYFTYQNTATVSGTRVIDGVTTTVVSISNPGGEGPFEEYLLKDGRGITNWGNNDPADTITPLVAAYQEFIFPLWAGQSFKQFELGGVDLGEDLDGDWINERVNMSSLVTVAGFESVRVPAGYFTNCAKAVNTISISGSLSSTPSLTFTGTTTATTWYAPGAGPVKIETNKLVTASNGESFSAYDAEVLANNFTVLAANIAPPGSDTESPGRPCVGYDGTNYLVISRQVAGFTNSMMIGVFLNGNGEVLKRIDIAPGDTDWSLSSNRPSIAFDGHNYFVVFARNGQIIGQRVTPEGVVLDGFEGFTINGMGVNPTVAFDGTNFLIAWQQAYHIHGARISPDGTVLGDFVIFSSETGSQGTPSIAFDGNNYLVVFSNNEGDIYATRVSPAGIPLDPGGIPVSTALGSQYNPTLVYGGGNFFLAWQDKRAYASDSYNSDIYGARITPEGNVLDPTGIPINTKRYIEGLQKAYPAVAFDGTNYFISWQTGSFPIYPPAGIFANWVSIAGEVNGASIESDGLSISGLPISTAKYVYPATASGTGKIFLAWINNSETYGEGKDLLGRVVTK